MFHRSVPVGPAYESEDAKKSKKKRKWTVFIHTDQQAGGKREFLSCEQRTQLLGYIGNMFLPSSSQTIYVGTHSITFKILPKDEAMRSHNQIKSNLVAVSFSLCSENYS